MLASRKELFTPRMKMKQYCRYCSGLVVGDAIYCSEYRKTVSESFVKKSNTCKKFELNVIDAFGENERGYIPREAKTELEGQMSIEDFPEVMP